LTNYVILTDSLTGEFKLEDAVLEFPAYTAIVGPTGGQRLYTGSAQNGVITRYDLGEDGKSLTESGTVDLAPTGATNLYQYGSAYQFVDEHKAYFYSTSNAKIVRWDPESMELLEPSSIETPDLVRENPETPGEPYTVGLGVSTVRDGDSIYFFAGWDSRAANVIKVAPASAVIELDTTTDTATTYVDERCGYARDGVVDGDYIYMVTEGVGSAVNHLNAENGAEPCMIRFNKVTKRFDETYLVKLNALADGQPVGGLFYTAEGKPFVHVLDTAVADQAVAGNAMLTNPRYLSVGPYWKTAALILGDEPSLEFLEITDGGLVATDRVNAKLPGNNRYVVQLR